MRGESSGRGAGATKAAATETFALLRRYVVQETFGPFRHLLRSVLYGVAGALALGTGTVILLLALLRVLQGETGTTFAGTWTFAPYLLTAVVALGLAGTAALVALRGNRRDEGTPRAHEPTTSKEKEDA